jgi:hypothetical protein
VLALAYYDTLGRENPEKREILGWMMIVTIVLVLIVTFLNMWRENYLSIRNLWRKYRIITNKKERNKFLEKIAEKPIFNHVVRLDDHVLRNCEKPIQRRRFRVKN